ncbi:hypothetical protein [Aurantiacibacter gilvus]|uniref:DNA-binding protein n=1 Tax=Aurantiacibacter gilvus TaxID=3139141 RepID=A0ABU9IHP0_9SPHN
MAEYDYSALDPAFGKLAKPAQRALLNNAMRSPTDLASHSRDEVLALHGIGPTAMPTLEHALAAQGLAFRDA